MLLKYNKLLKNKYIINNTKNKIFLKYKSTSSFGVGNNNINLLNYYYY